jgi:hypothetical protein
MQASPYRLPAPNQTPLPEEGAAKKSTFSRGSLLFLPRAIEFQAAMPNPYPA